MSNTNRADRIELLYKALKKHYKPTNIAVDRPVLDLLLYACCLEDAKFEAADEAFARLQQTYFDWNEVRVTTVAELGEVLGSLPNPSAAATRIKRSLQALFEHRYSFDLDELRKANLGKTVTDMEAWPGMTKFVISFVAQNALGGHAIPVDQAAMDVFKLFEVVTPQEAEKGQVPGLERAIAKSKGPEFATLLHQFAAEFKVDPKSATALALFKECGVNPKPKAPPPPPPPPKPAKKAAEPPKGPAATSGKGAAEGAASSDKAGASKGKASEASTAESKKTTANAAKKVVDSKVSTGKASEAVMKTNAAKKPAPPAKAAAPTKASESKPAAPANAKGTSGPKSGPASKPAAPGKPKPEKADKSKESKSKKPSAEVKKPTSAKKSAPPPPSKKIASKPAAKVPEKSGKVDNKKITKKKPK